MPPTDGEIPTVDLEMEGFSDYLKSKTSGRFAAAAYPFAKTEPIDPI
jgi:hypothetical protein